MPINPINVGTAPNNGTGEGLRIGGQKINANFTYLKQYVDALLQGWKWKNKVDVATTENIALSGEQTIDGVLTNASRVLVKNQTDATENGIYISGAGAWERSSDADTGEKLVNATVSVNVINANEDRNWTLPLSNITLGTTEILFVPFIGGTGVDQGTFDAAIQLINDTIDSLKGGYTGSMQDLFNAIQAGTYDDTQIRADFAAADDDLAVQIDAVEEDILLLEVNKQDVIPYTPANDSEVVKGVSVNQGEPQLPDEDGLVNIDIENEIDYYAISLDPSIGWVMFLPDVANDFSDLDTKMTDNTAEVAIIRTVGGSVKFVMTADTTSLKYIDSIEKNIVSFRLWDENLEKPTDVYRTFNGIFKDQTVGNWDIYDADYTTAYNLDSIQFNREGRLFFHRVKTENDSEVVKGILNSDGSERAKDEFGKVTLPDSTYDDTSIQNTLSNHETRITALEGAATPQEPISVIWNTGDPITFSLPKAPSAVDINGSLLSKWLEDGVTPDEYSVSGTTVTLNGITPNDGSNIQFHFGATVSDIPHTKETVTSKNLFNKEAVTLDKYINWNNGNLANNTSYNVSEFIKVDPNTDYYLKSFWHYALYDIDKIFISGESSSNKSINTGSAEYLRASVLKLDMDIAQIEEGTISTSYEAYFEPYEGFTLGDNVEATRVSEGIKTEIILELSPVPRISLPEKITAVVGHKQQLFFRGMIESNNPYQWNIKITGGVGGSQFPRYYEFTPTSAGNETFIISLYNDNDKLIASSSCIVEVINPIASPATNKKILCVGDSLTAAGVWTGELNRMLTGTGGTPTALGISNIEFIGTQGATPNKYEGYGGWSWATYNGSTSPFYNSSLSRIDFTNYVSVNGFGTIDYLITLLTWNQLSITSNVTQAKNFLNRFHLDFPDAKVKLLGIPLPSMNGGLGTTYGDANSNYGNYYDLLQFVFDLNTAYENLSNEAGYSGWVEFENVSAQFDNENNFPTDETPVNTRSATTEKRGNNGVHPKTEGYLQIADVAFRAFNSIAQ